MFRYGILIGSLLLILSACASSDTGSDSTAANAGGEGGSVAATTVTQEPITTAPAPPTSTTTEASAATTTQPVAAGPSEILLAIQDRGVINIATTIASPNFMAIQNFETGLAIAVADVLIPGINVAWLDVSASERFALVVNGDIDMGVRSTTATVSRAQENGVAFSQPYLLGGTVALVFADSGIASIEDLDGKTIAVSDGTGTMLTLQDALAQANVSATVDPYNNIAQVNFALSEGDVDVAAYDWMSAGKAMNELRRGPPLSMIPIDVLREPIAIFTAASDPAFAADVRAALQTVIDDGTWLAIYKSAFGAPPPWTVEEMVAVPPEDR